MRFPVAAGAALSVAALIVGAECAAAAGRSVFARDNLLAWCIVPFDAGHRGPVERARMLKRLGIRMFVYDWRDEDIPNFDREIDALNEKGIKLQGFWLVSGLSPQHEKNVAIVLDLLRRRKLKTQIWYLLAPPSEFSAFTQEEKVARAAVAVGYVAEQADRIGCSVGLYNHGGWFGEPENQLGILRKLGRRNVGIVYNFHHGREQMDRFAEFFPKIMPHLMAVNLNGMKAGGPMIMNLGEGDRELEMLEVVRNSGYQGPIGILNHRTDRDAEVGLRQNIEGLRNLMRQMGDEAALETY